MTCVLFSGLPLQVRPGEWRTQADVFGEIFFVFLALGTLVGVVVVAYTLYNAYKYRENGQPEDVDEDRPTLGELPTGDDGGKGKKLFLSFGISAIIVISLVVYAYTLLIYVESGPDVDPEAELEVDVEGYQFGWEFEYPNGHSVDNELRVPADRVVYLHVTSRDVWHNFGAPELRIKADSIPGETATTWFLEEETGTYTAECFELCGTGHSYMKADIIVMEPDEFEEWYEGTDPEADEDEGQGEEADEENNNGTDGDGEDSDDGDDTSSALSDPPAGPSPIGPAAGSSGVAGGVTA